MGLLDRWRPKNLKAAEKTAQAPSFKTITTYAPVFSSYSGGLYEQALTRAVVEKISTLASKLKPEIMGTPNMSIVRAVDTAPNQYMSWPKMIKRIATLLYVENTAVIVPSLDTNGNITGLFPLPFDSAEVVEYAGEPWVRFFLYSGETMAIELKYVCILTRFQYLDDFFGTGNNVLSPTMQLMDFQDQAQEQAIKNGAKIQFIAAAASTMRPEDIETKREKFSEDNLSAKNQSGLMIYDNTFQDMRQVDPKSYTVDADEMQRIQDNVYTYFSINKSILQADYTEEQFGAFYESVIEPFAVQLGEGLTQMLFTPTQRRHGNQILFSANRLEYASNASKRNMIRDMTDRCVMTLNEAREVLQMKPIERGDVYIARGEYYMLDKDLNLIYASGGTVSDDASERKAHKLEENPSDEDFDLGGDDQEYADVDTKGEREKDTEEN